MHKTVGHATCVIVQPHMKDMQHASEAWLYHIRHTLRTCNMCHHSITHEGHATCDIIQSHIMDNFPLFILIYFISYLLLSVYAFNCNDDQLKILI